MCLIDLFLYHQQKSIGKSFTRDSNNFYAVRIDSMVLNYF